MELDWIWKSILIMIVGTFLLRIAGRKSISQMTLAQTVVMIGIGSLLIQPVAGENIWETFGVGAILVITLFLMELAQIKSDTIEKLITGKSKALIENGTLNEKNLKKLRLTVDQLEMQLRQNSVTKISDVQHATLEPNGQLGFVLKEYAQAAKKEDIQKLTKDIQELRELIDTRLPTNQVQSSLQENIFTEVSNNSHKNPPPTRLQ